MRRHSGTGGGKWLRVEEVVATLRGQGFDASVSSVHRWINQGCRGQQLACRWLGGKKYVHPDDLEAFMQRDGGTPKAGTQQQVGVAGVRAKLKGGDGAQLASGDDRQRRAEVEAYLFSHGLMGQAVSATAQGVPNVDASGTRGPRQHCEGEGQVNPYPINVGFNAN